MTLKLIYALLLGAICLKAAGENQTKKAAPIFAKAVLFYPRRVPITGEVKSNTNLISSRQIVSYLLSQNSKSRASSRVIIFNGEIGGVKEDIFSPLSFPEMQRQGVDAIIAVIPPHWNPRKDEKNHSIRLIKIHPVLGDSYNIPVNLKLFGDNPLLCYNNVVKGLNQLFSAKDREHIEGKRLAHKIGNKIRCTKQLFTYRGKNIELLSPDEAFNLSLEDITPQIIEGEYSVVINCIPSSAKDVIIENIRNFQEFPYRVLLNDSNQAEYQVDIKIEIKDIENTKLCQQTATCTYISSAGMGRQACNVELKRRAFTLANKDREILDRRILDGIKADLEAFMAVTNDISRFDCNTLINKIYYGY